MLHNQSGESWWAAHAWVMRSLTTGSPGAKAPPRASALAWVAIGGGPSGPANRYAYGVVALRTARLQLATHQDGGGAPRLPFVGGACSCKGGTGSDGGLVALGVFGLLP